MVKSLAGRWLYRAVCAGALVFLVLPILAVMPLSFNAGSFITYPLDGVSLRWYEEVLTSGRWLTAVGNSLIVGLPATAIATVIGTLAALGLARARFPGKGLLLALLLSPMIVPAIIAAVAVYLAFAPLGLIHTFTGVILAHAALGAPLVLVTVTAALSQVDPVLMRAAASLGASPAAVFFRITLPLILPGLLSGALFALATSLDEVVVVLFLAGPEQRTLPRELFDGLREHVTPAITAVATLLVALATALMLALELLRRRGERLRAGRLLQP